MKTIAALIIGIVIGSASVATAAVSGYWEKHAKTYNCRGDEIRLFCKETNWNPAYEVAIFPGAITVSFSNHVIFGCKRSERPLGNCGYYVR